MGFINVAEKTINAKLVYYGVGMGGKTTSLQAVHRIMCPRNEVQLVSINTEEDSTLLFDFLPINLGQVEGFKIRIQGFTVPGQPKYKLMRKYVLSGADAVVFVVDSQSSRLEENKQSLDSLFTNLRLNGLDAAKLPIVVQYNKRDLDDILTEDQLNRHFQFRPDVHAFPSVAVEGQGVFETFVHAAGILVENKVRQYNLGKGQVDAAVVAEGARRKLWELHDTARGDLPEKTPKVRLSVAESTMAQNDPAAQTPTVVSVKDGDIEVLSDEELEFELGEVVPETAGEEEERPVTKREQGELLDRAVQSNVQLANRFGELDQYRALLERKNKELVEIAQNTVHDLNRPLSAIKLLLTTMDKGYLGELHGPLKDAVCNGLLATKQMERLIHDLLDSSRLDFDGVRLSFKDVDMTLLLGEVLRTLRPELEEKDVRVRVEPMPVIRADEWALTKVFMNLVGNAIQYAHPDRAPVVRVWCEEEDAQRVFHVQDNGIGIPEGDVSRLFRRFERGSNTSGISGTGLGLHIVREVAFGHGGNAWVESREGEGAVFSIAIPKHPAQPEHSPVTETAARADL
ncbi:MAG: hypothetical protein IT458_12180 [Planctomycetes bacterium]|nr:hypothetical protein [Planctomycetota bacterium]